MNYWLKRLGTVLALLLAVSFITFSAMNVLGDPLFNILGPIAADTENAENLAKIEAAKAQYHLDKPLIERYFLWLSDFVRGDFGVRFASDGAPPVSGLLKERLPRSLALMGMAQFIAVFIAIPWGMIAAARANKPLDKLSNVGAFFLVSLPNFALAVLLYYFFGVRLQWFPLRYDASSSLFEKLHQLALPALTLALPTAAVYQRLLRTDLITTLKQDFILLAKAKGEPKTSIMFKHALRPSMFSMLTVFGLNAGTLVGGALVVEQFFGIPGIGSAIVEAILREDFPVVLAIVMIVASGFVILNFLVDVAYSILDPRVRS